MNATRLRQVAVKQSTSGRNGMGRYVGKRSMTRNARSSLAVAAVLAALFAVTAGPAAAQPSNAKTLTYHFTDCSGPAGTPASFDAVKQPGGAAALHLVAGNAIFVVMRVVDEETGATVLSVPGFDHNNVPTVTCLGIHPVTLESQWVTGILTSPR
jgi:hypothetical protein